MRQLDTKMDTQDAIKRMLLAQRDRDYFRYVLMRYVLKLARYLNFRLWRP